MVRNSQSQYQQFERSLVRPDLPTEPFSQLAEQAKLNPGEILPFSVQWTFDSSTNARLRVQTRSIDTYDIAVRIMILDEGRKFEGFWLANPFSKTLRREDVLTLRVSFQLKIQILRKS